MKKLLLALMLFLPVLLYAQSPFDGTWVTNLNTAQLPSKPEVYAVEKGMYSCPTCVPKVDIKADGTDQKVAVSHYFDTASVKVVDAASIEIINKKDGKTVYTETDKVSPDGNSLSEKFSDQTQGNPEPVTGEVVMTRVSKGASGSHAVSGSWRAQKVSDVSKNGLTITLQATDRGLKMSTPTGQSYDAMFDGKEYPVQGDPGKTVVTLKKIGKDTIEETDKRDGKIVSVFRMTVSKDGKSINAVVDDKERGTKTTFTMQKQA